MRGIFTRVWSRLRRRLGRPALLPGDIVLVWESTLKGEHMAPIDRPGSMWSTPWLAKLVFQRGDAWLGEVYADPNPKYAHLTLTPRKRGIIKNPGDPVYLDCPLDRLKLWRERGTP